MSGLFVTVLTDEGQHIVMPGLEGENSQSQAKNKAEYWSGLGHEAKVGMVCLGSVDDLLKKLIPAPIWNDSSETIKDEYRDQVKDWMENKST